MSKNTTTKSVDIKRVKGNSFLTVSSFTFIGLITAAIPKIKSIFKILLPITLPRTISVFPLASALIDTANSGALVPKATIVSPISIFGTLKFWAIDDEPSTNISEPLIKNIKPITNKIISKIIITLTYINILTQNNYFKYYFLFFTLHWNLYVKKSTNCAFTLLEMF